MRALNWVLVSVLATVTAGCGDERAQSASALDHSAQTAPTETAPSPTATPTAPPTEEVAAVEPERPPGVSAQERQLRLIRLALEDCRGNARSLRERMREGDYADLAEHADEVYRLAQEARRAAIDIAGAEGELLMRDIGDLQHAADELRDAAGKRKHNESHHAMDGIDEALKRLEKDVTS